MQISSSASQQGDVAQNGNEDPHFYFKIINNREAKFEKNLSAGSISVE